MNTDLELQRGVKYNIYKALLRAAQLDCEQIFVEANGGNVTLRGTCRSRAERENAEQAAWALPGVTNVRNEIEVTAAAGAHPTAVN
jgi:osmotically-inducible protein OsmY